LRGALAKDAAAQLDLGGKLPYLHYVDATQQTFKPRLLTTVAGYLIVLTGSDSYTPFSWLIIGNGTGGISATNPDRR
jgi:hypothetical protein